MTTAARLIPVRIPPDPSGAVLVLHGGSNRTKNAAVAPTQLSVLRMVPIAQHIARAGRDDLAVFRLLNSTRGWNGNHTPIQDVKWALDQIDLQFNTRWPTCLVGHSLGGRAALLASNQPEVVSAVALAPWVYPDDYVNATGRKLLIVHGTKDQIAKPRNSVAVARALARTANVGYIQIEGGSHAMLSHHRSFTALASDFATATLLNRTVKGPIAQILSGRSWLRI